MLKRLIEVALPLKEVSEQSAREKSIRHGHISTLHIWWARRPLAACRAAVFASLIPDPDDPECPERFRRLVGELLGPGPYTEKFLPKGIDGQPIEDTPRNRCLEFIKHLVRWENSNNPEYIEPARKLIAAAHKFLHPDAEGNVPKVLDPFAGGGAIPLEALRLGCEAHAVDLNPVAHLIELCTLVYPQKYGQPDSRPVPDYIKRLIAHNKAKKKAKSGDELFDDGEHSSSSFSDDIIPDVEITEADYRKNPLIADIRYWGFWVLERTRRQIGQFYPPDPDGGIPVAYLWAKTVRSPDPSVKAVIPLVKQFWLCKKRNHNVALRLIPDISSGLCDFQIAHNKEIDFDPEQGTMRRGDAVCPFTNTVANVKYIREECRAKRMGEQLMAVVNVRPGTSGKQYRAVAKNDLDVMESAEACLRRLLEERGATILPNEPITQIVGRFNIWAYGLTTWNELTNSRQALALVSFGLNVRTAIDLIKAQNSQDYASAVGAYLGIAVSKLADFESKLCLFNYTGGRGVKNTFARQSLPMVWDYAESSPFNPQGANWEAAIKASTGVIEKVTNANVGMVQRGNATALPFDDQSMMAVLTDPPYYDAVPYADLSDFFYVWLKRTLADQFPEVFGTPLTPKRNELIFMAKLAKAYAEKTPQWYEAGMMRAFGEMRRVVAANGVVAVMFAHKTTAAWETLISGLIRAGLFVTASWPFHTEMKARMLAQGAAALASSVTLVCRRRADALQDGLWDDVRQELKSVAQERLDFFWKQGIRGADFFISAIGPALSVFGKYEKVTKLSGEEVTVGQFLDEVRGLVTSYALAKILKTTHTGTIDPESRFYVVWKWSYADAKVPADESFKLSQALGLDTETLWDNTGVLEKSGENVQATPVAKRIKVKNLGEPAADGAAASVIDVLHRMCAYREKGDTAGMGEFLGRSGHANNHSLWLIAQAVSEILPDGEKEKQLMQGLLNQKEGLEDAARQTRLF